MQTLDIQSNKIEDEGVLDVVSAMPDLRVLYLMGNPVVNKIRHYRKVIISRCKQVRLDRCLPYRRESTLVKAQPSIRVFCGDVWGCRLAPAQVSG